MSVATEGRVLHITSISTRKISVTTKTEVARCNISKDHHLNNSSFESLQIYTRPVICHRHYRLGIEASLHFVKRFFFSLFNPLTPNDTYSARTAPLTSKRFILYIYSTSIGTEYFKHGIYSPFFLFKMQFVS